MVTEGDRQARDPIRTGKVRVHRTHLDEQHARVLANSIEHLLV